MWTSIVWPPLTISATYGGSGGPCTRKFAHTCPSRWFTPTRVAPVASATAFAAAIPTRSAPTRPGPTVTATVSRSPNPTPAATRASSISGFNASTWARAATSGTTPPNRSCRWTCEAIRFERTVKPSSTTATAVSSHEVSMPRVINASSPSHHRGLVASGSDAAIDSSRRA